MSAVRRHSWKEKELKLLLVTTLLLSVGCQSSFYYNCHYGGEIDSKKKSDITAVSLQFAQAALAGDVDAAYSHFTEAAKANTPKDQLAGALQVFKPAGPFEAFQVERIMTVTGWGDTSKSNSVAICSKDAAHPEAGVTVAIQKIPEQAYALVSAKGKGAHETWIAAVWMIPRAEKWEVHAFHATIRTVLGKSADEYLAMARIEKNRGHALNAGLLYSDAASIAGRGNFYHTGIEDLIQQESQQVTPPQEFRGRGPFSLTGPSGSFSIVRLNTIGLSGKLYLVIAHEVDPWKNSREIEQKNQALIRTFAKQFPEYSGVFGGLVAEATARGGNNGWRTVEENVAIQSSAASHK
jgi:hypothetical protein